MNVGVFVPQFCPGFSCWKLGLADPRNSGAVETTGPPCPESNPPGAKGQCPKARECHRQLLAMTPFTMGAWWAILLRVVSVVTVLTWRLFTLSQDQNKGKKTCHFALSHEPSGLVKFAYLFLKSNMFLFICYLQHALSFNALIFINYM